MIVRGTLSRLKRRNAPNAVTSSGTTQPQTGRPGMGGASGARRAGRRELVSAAGCSASDAIIEPHRIGGTGHNVGSAMNDSAPKDSVSGTLTVAAGPIGRPGDASPLLAEALATTAVVAAEDTRRVRRLAAAPGRQPARGVASFSRTG